MENTNKYPGAGALALTFGLVFCGLLLLVQREDVAILVAHNAPHEANRFSDAHLLTHLHFKKHASLKQHEPILGTVNDKGASKTAPSKQKGVGPGNNDLLFERLGANKAVGEQLDSTSKELNAAVLQTDGMMATQIAAIRKKAEEIQKGTAATSGPDPPWAASSPAEEVSSSVTADEDFDGEATNFGLVNVQTVKVASAPHTKAAPAPLLPPEEDDEADEEGDQEEDMIALKMSSQQQERMSSDSTEETADDEVLTSLQAKHTEEQKAAHELMMKANAAFSKAQKLKKQALQKSLHGNANKLTALQKREFMELESRDKGAEKPSQPDTHVKEDLAYRVVLSQDTQALQKLKSQMALEVGHAKTLFQKASQNSKKGKAAARKAATLAKQVLTKAHTVAADSAKEKAAKKAEIVSPAIQTEVASPAIQTEVASPAIQTVPSPSRSSKSGTVVPGDKKEEAENVLYKKESEEKTDVLAFEKRSKAAYAAHEKAITQKYADEAAAQKRAHKEEKAAKVRETRIRKAASKKAGKLAAAHTTAQKNWMKNLHQAETKAEEKGTKVAIHRAMSKKTKLARRLAKKKMNKRAAQQRENQTKQIEKRTAEKEHQRIEYYRRQTAEVLDKKMKKNELMSV